MVNLQHLLFPKGITSEQKEMYFRADPKVHYVAADNALLFEKYGSALLYCSLSDMIGQFCILAFSISDSNIEKSLGLRINFNHSRSA